MTGQELLARAREDNVRLISLQFTDVSGTIKNLAIPDERLPGAIKEGNWFDGSSIEGFSRIFESDMLLFPDGFTYTELTPSRPPTRNTPCQPSDDSSSPASWSMPGAYVLCTPRR